MTRISKKKNADEVAPEVNSVADAKRAKLEASLSVPPALRTDEDLENISRLSAS